MSAESVPRPPTVAELLAQQRGVLSRRQARLTGLSAAAWQWRLDRGTWQAVLPGVVVGHSGAVTDEQRAWAALLYAGDGAALSADSALIEHGMQLDAPAVVHVAVPPDRIVRPQRFADDPAVRVLAHRVSGLDGWRHPVREPAVLRVVPAVLHAGAWAPSDRAAEWRMAAAVQQRLVRPADLRTELVGLLTLPRRRLLLAVVDDVELGAHAGSELDFLRFLRSHGLPAPDQLQRPVRAGNRCYLDAWWERQRVTVELDGAHHRLVGQWEHDALRANDVVLAERHDRVLLLRLTPGNLRHDGPRVAAQLRAALL